MALFQSKGAVGANLYDVTTEERFTLGTIVAAEDTSSERKGSAEFMYVRATSDFDLHDAVFIDYPTWGAFTTATNQSGFVGVAISTIPADSYGWVQITGNARVLAGSGVVDGTPLFVSSNAGELVDTSLEASEIVYGAIGASARDADNIADVQLNRPYVLNTAGGE